MKKSENDKDNEILKYVFKYKNLQDWKILNYSKNEVICYQGDIYPYFYVILNGRTNIYHTSEKGKSYSQSVYKKGNYFGELEIFDLRLLDLSLSILLVDKVNLRVFFYVCILPLFNKKALISNVYLLKNDIICNIMIVQ